jgi:hypothetical protein
MTASQIFKFVGIGYVYVYMPTNIVIYGEFTHENQVTSLNEQNIWVFTIGTDIAKLKGDTIIKIEK